jgi:hypothetical protein
MLVSLVRLKEAGRRVVLISLAEEPPPRERRDILVYHIPPTLPAFQKEIRSGSLTETALKMVPPPTIAAPSESKAQTTDLASETEQATNG